MPGTLRHHLAGAVELMGGERLMILPLPQGDPAAFELGQSSIENGQGRLLVVLGP